MSLGLGSLFAGQLKKVIKGDETRIENFVFALHEKWTFLIILVGLIFISSNNYLNSSAISCMGGDKYAESFCFLHGAAHIPKALEEQLSSVSRCTSDNETDDEKSVRQTNYYIWLPCLLTICAVITKLPRILWRNVLERGMMDRLVKDCSSDKEDATTKVAKRFFRTTIKGRHSWQPYVYNYGFALCECLNLVAICVNQSILNRLLNHEFLGYGLRVQQFLGFQYDPQMPEDRGPDNPLCHLFPTEVSCTVYTGAVTGAANKHNILCLLSNNVFNQYFFLVLWWWWLLLAVLSCLGLVYRTVQLCVPAVSR